MVYSDKPVISCSTPFPLCLHSVGQVAFFVHPASLWESLLRFEDCFWGKNIDLLFYVFPKKMDTSYLNMLVLRNYWKTDQKTQQLAIKFLIPWRQGLCMGAEAARVTAVGVKSSKMSACVHGAVSETVSGWFRWPPGLSSSVLSPGEPGQSRPPFHFLLSVCILF